LLATKTEKKLYEGMFLFDSNLAAKDWPGLEQHVQDLLQRNEAELQYSERWPDRRLSYEIKGCRKGTYYLTYFKAPVQSIQGLERDCQLSERILRLLVIHDDALAAECQKRINREVQGPPEEIEERKERDLSERGAEKTEESVLSDEIEGSGDDEVKDGDGA
jgi:small subunit ribosomal protein S6